MDINKMKRNLIWKIRFMGIKRQVNNKKDTKNIFLVGTPLHGNLGDHAIAKEAIRFIEENVSTKVVEIPSPVIGQNTEKFKNIIKDSTIIITGGGFMGSLWKNEEDMVQAVVKNFPNNKIIFFPQTLFFENTKKAEEVKKASKQIYSGYNLYFIAREEKTYELAKEIFKHVFLAPDIVLRMHVNDEKQTRSGCLLCMRKDKEKTLNEEQVTKIKEQISSYYNNIKTTDTVINKRVTIKNRETELKTILKDFKNSKLVITDRLHGMIFATVTKTPCIVFNNSSSKVKGVYQYIKKYANYVFFCEEATQLDNFIKEIQNLQEIKFDKNGLENEYKSLKQIIKGEDKNG